MESLIRRKTVWVFISIICLFLACFRAYPERPVKADRIRQNAFENLLSSAERWDGVRELTGNNDHPMITKAMKLCGLPGNAGHPWCAACQADIHNHAGIAAPTSARVVDWFKVNVVWKREWGEAPEQFTKAGMVGALYYRNLGRYGHIVLITGEDKNNYYCLEGNTNWGGSREGDGFYRTIRSKKVIAALADYCLNGKLFIEKYDDYLQKVIR